MINLSLQWTLKLIYFSMRWTLKLIYFSLRLALKVLNLTLLWALKKLTHKTHFKVSPEGARPHTAVGLRCQNPNCGGGT